MPGGNNNLFFIIFLILPIILIIFFIVKKKSGGKYQKKQRREEKDEVWATVKKFLKQNNEYGKEVIDTFTAKRPNPHDVSAMTKEQKIQYKIEQKELRQLKHSNPAEYKQRMEKLKLEKHKKQKELYVVVFTTRNPSTNVEDAPRVLECEVVMKKVDAKRTQRVIEIIGLKDYETEMKWIKPLKDKHDKMFIDRLKKEQERRNKLELKKQKQEAKMQAKKEKQNK